MKVIKHGIVPSILTRCNECRSILSITMNDIEMSDYIPSYSWPYIGGYNYSFNCPVCKNKNNVHEEQIARLKNKQVKVRARTRFR